MDAKSQEQLAAIPQLYGSTFDQIKEAVRKLVLAKIGPEPTRESVRKDMGPLLQPEDYLAVVVFVAAFVVSAIHITSLVGHVAAELAPSASAANGIYISQSLFVVSHQIAFALLAEFAMVLFMVRWRLGTRRREHRLAERYGDGPRPLGSSLGKFWSIDLVLSLLAVGFTLYANLESKLPVIESVMPPLFTIGIGFHLEHVFVELLHRQSRSAEALAKAIAAWQEQVDGVLSSRAYKQTLAKAVWDKYVSFYPDLVNLEPEAKWAIIQRDLVADRQFESYLQLAEQTSEKTMRALSQGGEWGLKGLLQATLEASEGSTGRLEVGPHWVDLGTLRWYNGDKGKEYGPYKGRGNMIAAMKMSSDRSASLQPV